MGRYGLDNIQLVDAVTGAMRMGGSAFWCASVRSSPMCWIGQVPVALTLTLDQIQQLGIDIDEQDFSAIQFNIAFTVNGETIPISMPVVAPKFTQSTELIHFRPVAGSIDSGRL